MIFIIHGPPAAGKTTLTKELSRRLSYPYYCRDEITGHILAATNINTKDQKNISYDLMYHLIANFCRNNHSQSMIFETNIHPKLGGEHLQSLIGESKVEIVEILLTAPHRVLKKAVFH